MEQNLDQLQLNHQRQVKTAFALYSQDTKQHYKSLYQNTKLTKYFEMVRNEKKQKLEKALEANQKFLNLIIESTQQQRLTPFSPLTQTTCMNISKMKSTIKQFYRQWCRQSQQIKDYHRIVSKFKQHLPTKSKILVPGCGMGRLVLELIEGGFGAQGNEVTYFMLFSSNFMLNVCNQVEQHEIFPFIHSMYTYEKEEDIFRSVRIPDKVASEVVPQDADFSIAAGQFTEVYGNQLDSFDGVATCFFIDTANNILAYIDTIWNTLKPGGIWVNFGPLLYHYREIIQEISVELSWQALKQYITTMFEFLEESIVQTTYCHDSKSNYTVKFKCLFTVCKKIDKKSTKLKEQIQ